MDAHGEEGHDRSHPPLDHHREEPNEAPPPPIVRIDSDSSDIGTGIVVKAVTTTETDNDNGNDHVDDDDAADEDREEDGGNAVDSGRLSPADATELFQRSTASTTTRRTSDTVHLRSSSSGHYKQARTRAMSLPRSTTHRRRSAGDIVMLDSIPNFRDLAEVSTEMKPNCIYRSATPSKACGIEAQLILHKLNIRTIVDFRETCEAEHDEGAKELYQTFKERDVLHGSQEGTDGCRDTKSSHEDDAEGQRTLVRLPYVPRKKMKGVVLGLLGKRKILKIGGLYIGGGLLLRPSLFKKAKSTALKEFNKIGLLGLNKIIIDKSHHEICALLKLCADERNHPILIHCSHGKDRTGLSAAIIKSVIGINRDKICLDYALSDTYGYSEEGKTRFKTEVPELDPEEWARAVPATMQKTLEYIDTVYGGIEGYCDAIGFTQEWRMRLKNALLLQHPFSQATASSFQSSLPTLSEIAPHGADGAVDSFSEGPARAGSKSITHTALRGDNQHQRQPYRRTRSATASLATMALSSSWDASYGNRRRSSNRSSFDSSVGEREWGERIRVCSTRFANPASPLIQEIIEEMGESRGDDASEASSSALNGATMPPLNYGSSIPPPPPDASSDAKTHSPKPDKRQVTPRGSHITVDSDDDDGDEDGDDGDIHGNAVHEPGKEEDHGRDVKKMKRKSRSLSKLFSFRRSSRKSQASAHCEHASVGKAERGEPRPSRHHGVMDAASRSAHGRKQYANKPASTQPPPQQPQPSALATTSTKATTTSTTGTTAARAAAEDEPRRKRRSWRRRGSRSSAPGSPRTGRRKHYRDEKKNRLSACKPECLCAVPNEVMQLIKQQQQESDDDHEDVEDHDDRGDDDASDSEPGDSKILPHGDPLSTHNNVDQAGRRLAVDKEDDDTSRAPMEPVSSEV